jgi:hypothetical protein
MKNKTIAVALIASFLSLAVWRIARSEDANSGFAMDRDHAAAEMRIKLDRAANNVRERLHMSVMIEASDDPVEEAEIAELYRSGWIIDATVDQVEAAIKAAVATPTLEDDIAARILAHRASCRYFFKE